MNLSKYLRGRLDAFRGRNRPNWNRQCKIYCRSSGTQYQSNINLFE